MKQRSYNNTLIPLEYKTLKPHECDYSYPFFCEWCNTKLVFDRKVRNLRNGLIALEYETDLPHVCTGRNRNVDDV